MLRQFCVLTLVLFINVTHAADRLVFEPQDRSDNGQHIVLVAGDEEYRTEESMPMLGKILSQTHGFKCTVLFSLSKDGTYIDPNNSAGVVGWEALDTADLMLIGTRFRTPSAQDAAHITKFLNAKKPVVGIRTATHAFNGKGDFGGISYGQFGRKMLGEQWVSHWGKHKREGARGVAEPVVPVHPILRGVTDVFAPSDVYEVKHLTADADEILMRAAVTETLDPSSPNVDDDRNKPMQPFAWLHTYQAPNGSGEGMSFCTTGGASVDLVNEDLRRMIVNAALYLTGQEVPEAANVDYIDPFYPSFFGFIKDGAYWKAANIQVSDFELGKSPHLPDPQNSPEWNFRPVPE